jgi:beta-glucosidase
MSAPRDLETLVSQLTLDEKASLTAGADFWTTVAIDRLGIPSVTVTDGPNGARGSALLGFGSVTAVCAPCGSALGSTWDPDLIERVGSMLGEESRTKAARVLLAPTVNIMRSPRAGRNFECYSEDPLLTGKIAAAFIRGVQSQDVATTVKHFAGNEAEFERHTISSQIDERTLREIYLRPFELAVREGHSLGIMTAYNRLNGVYCTERPDLLQAILRDEWGFEGFVVTDWFGAGTTVGAATAGVDLEMPGSGRFYGPALAEAVRDEEVDEALLDAAVLRLLRVFDRIGALDDPPNVEEVSIDRPEHRALAREAAAAATVLLANDGVLPIDPVAPSTVAVIGPNADRAQIMGGGSAALRPHYVVTPLEALRERFGPDVTVTYERGCDIDKGVPPLQGEAVTGADGTPGIDVEFFAGPDLAGEPVGRSRFPDSRLLFVDRPHPALPSGVYSWRASARFTPAETGLHTFTMGQSGQAKLFIDGEVVIDGVNDTPPPGERYFGVVSGDLEAQLELEAGRPVDVVIEYSSAGADFLRGVLAGCRVPAPDDLLERAVASAAAADVAVVVVGTNADWETEGEDRATLALPGAQDELVRRVIEANPRTVVVLNTGAPVTLPWADDAAAVVQMWFGGQEMAGALADVLTGAADPGGRLSMTFPRRIEDTPAFGNFPGEDGEVRYGEGVLVGYRWYDTRQVPTTFPFGHGLSYSTFEIGAPDAADELTWAGDEVLRLDVPVTNTGTRRGSEVVQAYVAPPPGPRTRPAQELRAFAKVTLDPGESTTVELAFDHRAFAAWDASTHEWVVEPGAYELRLGRSSTDAAQALTIDVAAHRAPA